jgi:hypothetical protein
MNTFAREDVVQILDRVPAGMLDRVFQEQLRKTLRSIGQTGDFNEFIELLNAFLSDLERSIVETGARTK